MQLTDITEQKGYFHSVRLEVTVSRFTTHQGQTQNLIAFRANKSNANKFYLNSIFVLSQQTLR
uniref:Uncharacterized protein n=1 Tax=Romanomermis culicivorax TaxID=13658 RepID=A0A915KNK9_ROMCU